ncbi:hypothetical protein GORHZ_030_00050 [Gordonia rhizosphera NBRC 16068]|uniref:Uncharacterized protein n=1 Tax=Gordonia rhizosphera NBRC 16068 TaxID=1108045 RepID=K6VNV8_9ACTN|nr:hypothetical protein GORHZ_030_00050 [Gordonia rhizosphera NBRC 16068]
MSGEEARSLLQLKSSFFSVRGQTSKPKIVTPPTGPDGPGLGLDLGSLGLGSLMSLGGDLMPGMMQLLTIGQSALNGRYDELGGITGPLGQVIGVPSLTPDANGVMQLFEHGLMLFSTQTGAHALTGQGLADYLAEGGLGELGFPAADRIG